ncbi:probable polygalacturonase At3g15720 [Malania oleifera]|uniref:probable polygalacturonase At3g15720 n=1 Tax=Malania oleifera TaxID=397392 RepID=UPI0025AE447C|nr:probable polygalacturonase At3g15720 [Malania oleifera]
MVVFIDDMLVDSKSSVEYEAHMRLVLQERIKAAQKEDVELIEVMEGVQNGLKPNFNISSDGATSATTVLAVASACAFSMLILSTLVGAMVTYQSFPNPTTKDLSVVFFILCLASSGLGSTPSFNVIDYGAVGDGRTDDSPAFLKAWKAACQAPSNTPTLVVIPGKRTFLLKPATFSGPCKPPRITFRVEGNIVAPNQKAAWKGFHVNTWLVFSSVNGLTVNGGGQFDGQGSAWWSQLCSNNALTFRRCNNLRLNGLRHTNSQRNHMTITACNGAVISNLNITAPGTSPNTDGINIASSSNIQIRNSIIATGDDCIAVSGGSSNINITGISCGPGHGISIGSLGQGGYDTVENVNVQNCTLIGTLTGVRIKTWQGGSGYARKISFKGIKLVEVITPIIIDQFYCPSQVNCQNKTSAVKVSDVSYRGIVGTSSSADKVINLSCSQTVGCTDIQLDHVYIKSTVPGKKARSFCFNAYGRATHTKPIVRCLSKT